MRVGGHRHAPASLRPGKGPVTPGTGGCGAAAPFGGGGENSPPPPPPNFFRYPDRPARRQPLYQISYSGPYTV